MLSVAVAGVGLAVAWTLSCYSRPDLVAAARDAVFAELRDGVFVLDSEDRIADLNQTAQRIVGHDAEALRGQPAADVLPSDLAACLQQAHSGGAVEITAGDGPDARVYEVRLVPLSDASGQPAIVDTTRGRAYEQNFGRPQRPSRLCDRYQTRPLAE